MAQDDLLDRALAFGSQADWFTPLLSMVGGAPRWPLMLKSPAVPAPLRQPSEPPSSAVWLLEYATARLAKSSPWSWDM